MNNVTAQVKTTPALVVELQATDLEDLVELGLPAEFVGRTDERLLLIDVVKARPCTSKKEAGHGNWKEITLMGELQAFGVVVSKDRNVRMIYVTTTEQTIAIIARDKAIWNFTLGHRQISAVDFLEEFFNDNLRRGPRAYDNNANLLPNFWLEVMRMVCPEGGIRGLELTDREGNHMPSRLYFNPTQSGDQMISVGGMCYDFDLNVFPRSQIARGTAVWTGERRSKEVLGKKTATVSLASVGLKVSNSQKKQQRPAAVDAAKLGLKGELAFGRVLTEEKLIEAINAPERTEKAKVINAPVAKKEQKQRKKA